MDLHRIVSGAIGAINPMVPATVQISTGYTTSASGLRTPSYATPGSITAAISGTVLTVSAVASGKLMEGQTLAGVDVASNTIIGSQISGTTGGVGTYNVSPSQSVASETMTTSHVVQAQVQDLSQKDLRQLDALNIQGSQKSVYIAGSLSGLIRKDGKGGDLVVLSDGTWLVTAVLEAWPDWCKASITLQN